MRFAVKGNELKSVFKDVSALLKRYERAKVLGVSVNKSSVVFTVDTGTYYTRTLDFLSSTDIVELNVTILYADITSFLSGRDEAVIELTEHYMQVKSKGATMTLSVGESTPPKYAPKKGNVVSLELSTILKAAKVFSSTQDLQKAYKKDFAIIFSGDTAIMKTPTVWIETNSCGLNCVLSLAQLKSVTMFQPKIVEISDRLEFKKEKSILSMPLIKPEKSVGISYFKEKMQFVSAIVISGIIKELLDVKKAVGVGDATIRLYPSGFGISISKGGVSLEKTYGTGDFTQSIGSFMIMLDIFIMSLNILSDDEVVGIYIKEDLVCLENTVASILLSV